MFPALTSLSHYLPFFPAALFTVIAGAAITATGHFTPLVVGGAAVWTVGAGLITTWSQTTTVGQWIGYQILAGMGVGLSYQGPILAAQALASPTDLSATSAMLLFFQTMGGAFMVSAAQTAFTNQMMNKIREYSPQTDVAAVVATGVTEIRKVYQGAELTAILRSYSDGLQVAFAIMVALTGIATLCAFFLPWKSIKAIQAERGDDTSKNEGGMMMVAG